MASWSKLDLKTGPSQSAGQYHAQIDWLRIIPNWIVLDAFDRLSLSVFIDMMHCWELSK